MLVSRHPDVAADLLATITSDEAVPIETDYSKINTYFLSFCSIHCLIPSEYTGGLHKVKKTEFRKLFVACILHLYAPALLTVTGSLESLRVSRTAVDEGLVKRLAESLKVDKSHISRSIREVIMMQRVYDDFRINVESTIERLKEVNDACA